MVFLVTIELRVSPVSKLAKLRLQLRGELSGTCIMIYYYDSAIFVIHECILILTIILLEQFAT